MPANFTIVFLILEWEDDVTAACTTHYLSDTGFAGISRSTSSCTMTLPTCSPSSSPSPLLLPSELLPVKPDSLDPTSPPIPFSPSCEGRLCPALLTVIGKATGPFVALSLSAARLRPAIFAGPRPTNLPFHSTLLYRVRVSAANRSSRETGRTSRTVS